MAEAFTTENPTNEALELSLKGYRRQLEDFLLDENTPIYDRLHSFFATQEGNWREYSRVPTIDYLQRAEQGPILVNGIGQMAIGRLVAAYPWRIVDMNSDLVPRDERPRELGLAANFANVRLISSDASYLHESYGQSSTRAATGPVMTQPETSQITVDLGKEPAGSEHFILRLKEVGSAVAIGVNGMHERIQRDNQDPAILVALHAATSMALAEIG